VQAATDPEFPIKWPGPPLQCGPKIYKLIVYPISLEEVKLVSVKGLQISAVREETCAQMSHLGNKLISTKNNSVRT
jgi:hypothetical protein